MSKINIYFEAIKPVKFKKNAVKNWVSYLVKNEQRKTGIINIVLCSDEYLLEMNKKYLQHDYYTDIITFDYVEGEVISGDLFISVDRVKENADNFKNLFLNELMRVIFHGVLHLVGFKDKTEEEQAKMREKENFYLSVVDISEMEL